MLLDARARIQRGLNRGFYTVYAGRIRSRITRERNMSLAIDESPTPNSKEMISQIMNEEFQEQETIVRITRNLVSETSNRRN